MTKPRITSLSPSDQHHLLAAEGWRELGNYAEAFAELDEINPLLRGHPDVLGARIEVYHAAAKWDYVLALASTLVDQLPKRRFGWIERSFALHALGRTQEAFDLLLPAAKRFPKYWLVAYNLACYCAQLGRIHDSEGWFEQAMTLNEREVKAIAIDDPDLAPLW